MVGAPMNDVVMIYYQGSERGNSPQEAGSAGRGVPADIGISGARLVEFLSGTPGAHVMWLDEQRPAPAGPAQPG